MEETTDSRRIHCHRKYKNIELIIFEGGHEILEGGALGNRYEIT